MNLFKNRFYEGDDVPKSTYLTFAICTGFKDAIFQFISLFLLLYVQFGTKLSEEANFSELFTVCTFGIILVKIVAPLFFTIVPYCMNKFKFKCGNFRPWIFIGSTISTICFIFMFLIPFTGWAYVFTFVATYFLFELSFAFEDTGFWGFMPTMTSNEQKRSLINSLASACSCLFSYALTAILPAVTGGQAGTIIKIIAISIAVLFLITQYIFGFIMKENIKKTNEKPIKPKLFDMFRCFFKNKFIIISNICFCLSFLAQFCIVGNSVNYFYYNNGYGTETIFNSFLPSGGFGGISFIFSILYGLAYVVGFLTYPLLTKKFNRKQILTFSVIITIIGHVCFFTFLFNRNMLIPLFLSEFFIFYFQCLINAVYAMATTIPIEYNELKFGERRDAEFLSIRNLFVKYAGAFQTGIFYIFLVVSGLFELNSKIGAFESMGVLDPTFDVIGAVNNAITSVISSDLYDWHLVVYRIGMIALPSCFILISYFLYMKFYTLDETKYKNIVNELQKKNNDQINSR